MFSDDFTVSIYKEFYLCGLLSIYWSHLRRVPRKLQVGGDGVGLYPVAPGYEDIWPSSLPSWDKPAYIHFISSTFIGVKYTNIVRHNAIERRICDYVIDRYPF